jgi:hypothetical protein
MRSTITLIAGGYWLLIAVPMWWFSVAFGAPVIPRPVGTFDPVEAFFLASFYLPPALLVTLGLMALWRRAQTRR